MNKLARRIFGMRASRNDAASGGALKRNMPLVPADSIAGRALVTVIGIMTFLAAFMVGVGIMIHGASREWTDSIAKEITIQVRPSPNRDIEVETEKAAAIARATAGVAGVRIFGKAESEHLLEPWLGTGLDLGELPVPRLVVVELSNAANLNAADLKDNLRARVPTAFLDDHRLWMERLAAMAQSLVVLIVVFLALVLVSMGLAVAFATRGAMAGNKGIVDILHFVGATDRFIAVEFQRHFLRLGLRGGAIGVLLAILGFSLFETLSSWWARSPGGDQMEVLFGTFSLGWIGYAITISIGGVVALLTGLVSRIIVFRHLRGFE